MKFEETVCYKENPDKEKLFSLCQEKWDRVAKPLNSLGEMEKLICRVGFAEGTVSPKLEKRKVLVFCADNGVVEEGVSQSDHTVTTAVAKALASDSSNVNIMAKIAGARVEVYDVGMKDDLSIPNLIVSKTANGTDNFTKQPAMTKEACIKAIETGINAAVRAKEEGCDILVVGEMGIGNTTTSTAVLSVLLDIAPAEITGRGSGLSDEGLQKKINAIRKGIEINQPDRDDAADVLAKVGGYDISAMCGVFLGGMAAGIPVVIDGLIAGAAALAASRINPNALNYMLPSHVGKEPGISTVLSALHLTAPICASMALGEGTGGVMLLPLLDMALAVYNGDHSFESIGMDAYEKLSN